MIGLLIQANLKTVFENRVTTIYLFNK